MIMNAETIAELGEMIHVKARRQAPHLGAINPDAIDMSERAFAMSSRGHGWAFADRAITELRIFYCRLADRA